MRNFVELVVLHCSASKPINKIDPKKLNYVRVALKTVCANAKIALFLLGKDNFTLLSTNWYKTTCGRLQNYSVKPDIANELHYVYKVMSKIDLSRLEN